MPENSISIQNATYFYGDHKAIDNLSLNVPKGIIFGFLGPNGAGKTTTIRLLLGLIKPSAGKLNILGYETQHQADEVRSHTGALLEHTGLYEQLSAQDNLEFYGRVYQLPPNERKNRIKELLGSIGLWDRRQEPVKKWSRGMKQKLALARVLLHRPELVLLDEPTAGLDVTSAVEVRRNLTELVQEQGVTVFLTTHNMVEAEQLCTLLGVINNGKLVASGQPEVLKSGVGQPRVEIAARGVTDQVVEYLSSRPEIVHVQRFDGLLTFDLREETDPAFLVDVLVSSGVQIDEVRRNKASLEEVFITLVQEEK